MTSAGISDLLDKDTQTPDRARCLPRETHDAPLSGRNGSRKRTNGDYFPCLVNVDHGLISIISTAVSPMKPRVFCRLMARRLMEQERFSDQGFRVSSYIIITEAQCGARQKRWSSTTHVIFVTDLPPQEHATAKEQELSAWDKNGLSHFSPGPRTDSATFSQGKHRTLLLSDRDKKGQQCDFQSRTRMGQRTFSQGQE